MARDLGRAFAPTIPDDQQDPPRFAQPIETTKDCFVLELRRFFENSGLTTERQAEVPTIQKYSTFTSNDPQASAVAILRKFPETLENLPHIAVLATTGQERRLTIGPPFIAQVQDPPALIAPIEEPYAFEDGDLLVFRIVKRGRVEHVEHITLATSRFPSSDPITAALASDVAAEINAQSYVLRADVYTDTTGMTPLSYLRVASRDDLGEVIPSEIEVHYDTTANAATATGWARSGDITDIDATGAPDMTFTTTTGTLSAADIGRYVYVLNPDRAHFNEGRFVITDFAVDTPAPGEDTITYTNRYGRTEVGSGATYFVGDRDDQFNHVPSNRYGMSWDMSVQINVLTEDENTRGEAADLVASFLGFFLEEKMFTFWGRTGFPDQAATNEYYQIVIQPPVRSAAEDEIPRPTDGIDKIYINSFSVSVTTTQFLDRQVYQPGSSTVGWVIDATAITLDENLPTGNSDEPIGGGFDTLT